MEERDEDVPKLRRSEYNLNSSTNTPRESGPATYLFCTSNFFHGLGSYTKVSENKENTQERLLTILLIECPANVSNSCLHLGEQKLAIQSKE